jgi:hypothetical protein
MQRDESFFLPEATMPAVHITLAGQHFVILPAEEYRSLRAAARETGQDAKELAEANARLADAIDKAVPYDTVRKRLGLKRRRDICP